jgi:hypothetical protein
MSPRIHKMPGILPGKMLKLDQPKRSPRIRLFILGLALIGGSYWFVYASPTFAVEKVEITGVDEAALATVAHRLIGRNIFRLSTTAIEADMKQVYPPVASLTLIRGLPRSVRLQVALRQPMLRWQILDKTYIIDATGQVFDEGEKPDYADLPKVIDTSSLQFTIGQHITTPAFIEFVTAIPDKATALLGRKHVANEIKETMFHVDVLLDGDVRIRLTTQRPLEEQLEAAKTIASAHPDAKLIDVRVPGWGYWK